MATLLAAGAASCAGYIIGNLAVKKTPRPVHPGRQPPPFHPVHHLPPRRVAAPPAAILPAAPSTRVLHAGYVPAPKRVMPGQCYLCESWFQHGDVVAKLYCGHVFHRQCMETFARQPVYETFRCTCVVCRGGSWITRFAVTEINTPAAPSVAPFTPVVPVVPVVPHVPQQHVAERVVPQVEERVEPHVPTIVQPVSPPPAPRSISPPAPPVHKHIDIMQQSVISDMSSTSTATSTTTSTEHVASVMSAVKQVVPPSSGKTSKHHTYISLQPSAQTQRPSCTLCSCKLCVQNNDGNCAQCGRCLCYECMYADCECCCSCTPDVPSASHAAFDDFVPLY